MSALLEIEDLQIEFETDSSPIHAVRGVSLRLAAGETLAVVGESGAGKSALCKSILRILPAKGHITGGSIRFDGRDLLALAAKEMRGLRGGQIAMILQDPATSLDPTRTIGMQICETIRLHERISRKAAAERAESLLRMAGIDAPRERLRQYPHQLSGGQRQRAVIAMALCCRPRLLLADEPTTALDATVQAQILSLLKTLQKETGAAILLVTHDLLAAARLAHRTAVMYAGRVVETGTAAEVFGDPRHPYTWGLMSALPAFAKNCGQLRCILGAPPDLREPPRGDPFAPRNPYALAIDYEEEPPLFHLGGEHYAASWLCDPRAPEISAPIRLHCHAGVTGGEAGE